MLKGTRSNKEEIDGTLCTFLVDGQRRLLHLFLEIHREPLPFQQPALWPCLDQRFSSGGSWPTLWSQSCIDWGAALREVSVDIYVAGHTVQFISMIDLPDMTESGQHFYFCRMNLDREFKSLETSFHPVFLLTWQLCTVHWQEIMMTASRYMSLCSKKTSYRTLQ